MNILKTIARSSLAPVLFLIAALPSGMAQTIYTAYHFTTIAGRAGSTGSTDGVGSAARFYQPQGVTVDSNGTIYVADSGNDTIREITSTQVNGSTTWTVTTLAGSPGVPGIAAGTGSSALFEQPHGICLLGGLIYVYSGTYQGATLDSVTPGGAVTVLYEIGFGYADDVIENEATLLTTSAAAIGPNGNQYEATSNGSGLGGNNPSGLINRILEYSSSAPTYIDPRGTWVLLNTIVGSGQVASPIDGPMGTANADDIAGVAVDSNDNVYFTETLTDQVRKVTRVVSNGVESWNTTTLGGVVSAGGNSDGTGAAAHFSTPVGIAVDSNGDLYVADQNNDTIRMGVPDTGPVATSGTASAVLGQPVTFALPATDPFGDSMTFAIIGTTGGSATLSGNQATFTPSAAGTGTVTFTASDGYVTSSPGTVTISTIPSHPVISQAAASQTVGTGRSVAFNAQATGYPTPTYQWTLNGSATIPGATVTNDSVLLVSGATSADAGTYVCTATNSAGTATTSAILAVATTGTAARLDNLSARAEDLSGGNILIAGLTIGGSGTEPVLLRAVGPGLVGVGVGSGLLPNPVLTVFDNHSLPIVADAGWGNAFTTGSSTANITPAAATANLMTQVGAFPITQGSTDSAMEVQMAPGSYTLEATDANGATGVALAEVYDAGSGGAIRLTNISARADVGAGGDILIGGLTISGSTAETVLLRAVGPGLVNQNLPNNGLLAQPSLAVYQGSTQIYGNTGWGSDPVIQSVFSAVGATALDTADSAVLITLPAGGYTVLVSGAGGATGIGLVEVYEVY